MAGFLGIFRSGRVGWGILGYEGGFAQGLLHFENSIAVYVHLCTLFVSRMEVSVPDTVQSQSPLRVGVREFRGNMTGYLKQVSQGETILITSHGEVMAELRPPAPEFLPPRQPGGLRGKIWMAPDFDDFPEDLLDLMEGKED